MMVKLSILPIAALFLNGNHAYTPSNTVPPPPVSRATQLPNEIYTWRNQQVRYQVARPADGKPSKGSAVLVHGLFVNSDHWRYTLKGLAEEGYTAYAIDLLGSGYSSKPSPQDAESRKLVCGESNGRFASEEEKVKKDVTLGTASGGTRIAPEVDLKHPCESPYNFYTWSEQICDFTKEVVLPEARFGSSDKKNGVTLVSNSIGTISSLQSALDEPNLFNGVFVVNPNFRELHSAEIPFPDVAMPIVRSVQSLLRSKGQGIFEALAKPDTVKQILMEPYAICDAVDDELVDVLLTPLLTPGASDVVFDTLSYSAGPLPEQQLSEEGFPRGEAMPVWICYGSKDPWTPAARVEKLGDLDTVEKVIRLEGVGHCPHDEAPELVNPLLIEFMQRVRPSGEASSIPNGKEENPITDFFSSIFG
uniref:AB hydrolase-1 domain-containing protein n=1 Tax=Chaetoceros debilis TaxID=122233 RepID=A0A7S3VH08_9STRA|mmetsp:Transcript_6657/g.9765  ORF Transcript_6657/g.9765 Transcript_6657/m.9765 type:complete len:419 (+) Transcript_6657:133-1389(+)